jgi:hypothetical protein
LSTSTVQSTYEKEAGHVSSLSDMRDGDIEAAHYVLCPICSSKYSPQLHIHCYNLKNIVKSSPVGSDPLKSVKPQWIPLKSTFTSPISAINSPETSFLGTFMRTIIMFVTCMSFYSVPSEAESVCFTHMHLENRF